jgi:SAM-dependent methyltransferase
MGSTGSHRAYGQVFDQAAEAYDEFRPGYPPSLVGLAVERGGLTPGSRVLEVGCGTGKLTERLVERGLLVDAVDPGPNMIATARKRVGPTDAVTFHLGRFEDVDLPGPFDAVFSATAFHWIDPEVSWAKVAEHLEPSGLLALMTHLGLRTDESAGLQDEFLELVNEYAPDVAAGRRPPRELDVIIGGVPKRHGNASEVWDWVMGAGRHGLAVPYAAELFEDVQVDTELRTSEENADELVAHFKTTSLYHRIAPGRRDAFEEADRRLIERHGGTIRLSFAAVLMTALRA